MSVFSLFRYASFLDSLLITIGALFAVLEGAGPPAMAVVFGGMTNILVDTVRNGFTMPDAATGGGEGGGDGQAVAPANGAAVPPVGQASTLPLSPEDFEAAMSVYSILYVFIGVAIYISSLIQITCWQVACERLTHRIRRSFFRSVLRQELAWFDKNQAGELSAKLNDDVERIRDGTGEQFSAVIKYTSSFISGFVVGFVVSWRLTLVIVAATPLLALFSAYLGRMLATSTKREQEKYAKAGAIAEEVLVSIRTVFALGGQRGEIKNYSRKLEESKLMAAWKYVKLGVVIGLSMFVLYSTYGLALFVAARLLSADLITPGSAMTVIMSVMMGASALGNVIPPLQTIAMAKSSASLIYEIMDSVPNIDASDERGLKLSKVTANIRFDKVNFSYPTRSNVQVLKDLTFNLQQGQTVAICGRTGSGKSTVMNLLLRFYDPSSGAIYLDNCNLRDLNVAWLRSLAGIVEQEPALFDCSIYENISLGATSEADRNFDKIVEAAKLANAHDFITKLPEGYNTRCGDRGVQMSGGQKQRIAIARALLSDPKILLLDEATSALDSESESMVQSALNKARKGRTTVVIAHRLSTIRDADLICVMENGAIVESGKHDELMARKQHYFDLVTNQIFTDDNSASKENSDENLAGGGLDSAFRSTIGGSKAYGLGSQLSGRPLVEEEEEDDLETTFSEDFDGIQSMRRDGSIYLSGRLTTETSRLLQSTRLSGEQYSINSSGRKYSANLYDSFIGKSQSGYNRVASIEDKIQLPTWMDIIRLVKPELNWIFCGILAASISGALLPVFALLYAQIFDTFTKTGDELIESGNFWALMFVALGGVFLVSMFFRIFVMAVAVEKVMARIRSECFKNIMRQHVGWFDNPKQSPQRLTTRLASDVPQIKAVLNARLSAFISGLATIIAALVIAFYLGWKLAILLTVALPILLYVGYLQMVMTRGDRSQYIRRMENASRLATEAVEHVKLIQAINQERYFIDKFNQELAGPLKESLASARRIGLVYGLSQSVIYFVYGASFRYGAYLMARQELEPVTVFRIFFSIAFTAVAVGQWGGFSGDLSRANHAIALIIKLLTTRPEIDNLSRGGIKPRIEGRVEFEKVQFAYPTRPDTPVLQGLNMTIEAGQTLALVGPSGNGKSTIAALLLRFYDPDQGVVRVDGHNIRCINLNHLRFNIGIVSQEPCLFKASIKDNILYGLDKSTVPMRDVIKAAKLANIHDFIDSLPQGYDTQVGDRGSQMSGGQKQRISIARAMIRNPAILILDEATSALDAESEALVNQALEEAARGKTCIKIAHRLSTVRDADQIAVIEKGVIAEIGSHDELMSKRGHYFRLMQKQEISS